MTNKACDIWLKRAVILSFISLASCATLARGTSEIFHITTEPIGAKVTTSLETADSAKARKKDDSLTPIYHGCAATPCQFKVPRRSRFIARIEKDGFVPARLRNNGDNRHASFGRRCRYIHRLSCRRSRCSDRLDIRRRYSRLSPDFCRCRVRRYAKPIS